MTDYKKVTRKSRDQKENTQGVKIRKKRELPVNVQKVKTTNTIADSVLTSYVQMNRVKL